MRDYSRIRLTRGVEFPAVMLSGRGTGRVADSFIHSDSQTHTLKNSLQKFDQPDIDPMYNKTCPTRAHHATHHRAMSLGYLMRLVGLLQRTRT